MSTSRVQRPARQARSHAREARPHAALKAGVVRASPSAGKRRLALLGTFEFGGSDRPLPKKAQAMLAYLALHPDKTFARDHVAALLWGAHGVEQARRSLRQCLMSLRPVLGDALQADADVLKLDTASELSVDVLEFERLSASSTIEDLEAASLLYRDALLAGLRVASDAFGEWLSAERRRLASMLSDVLYRLGRARAEQGRHDDAIAAARRLTAFDPLREEGHRLLMQLLAAAGRRDAALEQYRLFADLLRRDLGAWPEAATQQLAATLRSPSQRAPEPHAETMPADRASIAVLPFASPGAGRDEDYFADGIAEDLTVALGRMSWLFVVASYSVAAYRGGDVDLRHIGAQLGVLYLLRGSVRRSAGRVRVTVELSDAAQGRHIWAEHFDSPLDDLFAIQDEVTTRVTGLIVPTLHRAEIERSLRKVPGNLGAYDLYLRALPLFRRSLADNREALGMLYRAIDLDPGYAAAYAFAARCYQFQKMFGWVAPSDAAMAEGVRLARRAAQLGTDDSEALWMAGLALVQLAGETGHGLALITKSLQLNPNSATAWIAASLVHAYEVQFDASMEAFNRAQRLNPLDWTQHVNWIAPSQAHFSVGHYEEAIVAADKTLHQYPAYVPALRIKGAACGLLGRLGEGRECVNRVVALSPGATLQRTRDALGLYFKPTTLDLYIEGLRRSGLPEG
jgi:TolB-like protein